MNILETTLRDGSYVIDFQFTVEDTVKIALALEKFGFEYIEIGHGLGLNASNCGKGVAAATDEEYMKGVSKALKKSKWGMFFIPGIGDYKHIDMAVDYGMKFIRIGTNVTESEIGLPFIEYAKKKGLIVSANMMKSYAVSPQEFAKRAKMAEDAGADIVCLVDSAGGMLPDDIEKYFTEVKAVCNVKLGFHGHDNFRLAIANSLKAIECGAFLVDTSLQGLGRGGGNAPTEVLVSILMRKGLIKNFDLYGLLDFSKNVIKVLLREKGIEDITLISAYAFFHSSYFPLVEKYAEIYRVDPRKIIVELSKKDIVNPSEELIEQVAKNIKEEEKIKEYPSYVFTKTLYRMFSEFPKDDIKEEVKFIIKRVREYATKFNKYSVFNIVVSPPKPGSGIRISKFIQDTSYFIIGSCEIYTSNDLVNILDEIDGNVDIILYDAEVKNSDSENMLKLIREKVKKSILLLYKDTEAWAETVENLITELLPPPDKSILLIGESFLQDKLYSGLNRLGYKVYRSAQELGEEKVDAIVGTKPFVQVINIELLELLKSKGLIIDAGIKTISQEAVKEAFRRRINIIRPDMRGTLEGVLVSKINSYQLVNKILGRKEIAGIPCVAGGLYGDKNSVVLDSINDPRYIIGLADGMGEVKYILKPEEIQLVKKVEEEILKGNF